MSATRHESEIQKDADGQDLEAKIAQLTAMVCPFCGEMEIYVYPPDQGRRDQALPRWMHRAWWTVGCQSRRCDSGWRIEKDLHAQIYDMMRRCQTIISENA